MHTAQTRSVKVQSSKLVREKRTGQRVLSLAAMMAVYGSAAPGWAAPPPACSTCDTTTVNANITANVNGLPKANDILRIKTDQNTDWITYNNSVVGNGSTGAINTLSLGNNTQALINWSNATGTGSTGFDITSGNTLNITGTGASLTLLNVISGSNTPTTIAGTINTLGPANVIIVNPNGIAFTNTSSVSTNTTLGLYTKDSDAGVINLNLATGNTTLSASSPDFNMGTFSTPTSANGKNVAISKNLDLSGGDLVIRADGVIKLNVGDTGSGTIEDAAGAADSAGTIKAKNYSLTGYATSGNVIEVGSVSKLQSTGILTATAEGGGNIGLRTVVGQTTNLGDVNAGTGTVIITAGGVLTQGSTKKITANSTVIKTTSHVGTAESNGLNISATGNVPVFKATDNSGSGSTNSDVYINAVDGNTVKLDLVKADRVILGNQGGNASGTGTFQGYKGNTNNSNVDATANTLVISNATTNALTNINTDVNNLLLDGAGNTTINNTGALKLNTSSTTKSGGATISITNDAQITVDGTFDYGISRGSTLSLSTGPNQVVLIDTNTQDGIKLGNLNIVSDTVTITNASDFNTLHPTWSLITLDNAGTASLSAKTTGNAIDLGTGVKTAGTFGLTAAEIAVFGSAAGGTGTLTIGAAILGNGVSTGAITISDDITSKPNLTLYGGSLAITGGAITVNDGTVNRAFAATVTGDVSAAQDAAFGTTAADITASTLTINADGKVGAAGLFDLDITASGVVNITSGKNAGNNGDIYLRSYNSNLSLGTVRVRNTTVSGGDIISLILDKDVTTADANNNNLIADQVKIYGVTGATTDATALGASDFPIKVSQESSLVIRDVAGGALNADSAVGSPYEGVHISTDQSWTLANDLYTNVAGTGVTLKLTATGTTFNNNGKAIDSGNASDVVISAPEFTLSGAGVIGVATSGENGTVRLTDTEGDLSLGAAGGAPAANALNVSELAAIKNSNHIAITASDTTAGNGDISLGGAIATWALKNVTVTAAGDITGGGNTLSGAILTLSAKNIGASGGGNAISVTPGTRLVLTANDASGDAYVTATGVLALGNVSVTDSLTLSAAGNITNDSSAATTISVGGLATIASTGPAAGTSAITLGTNGATDTVNFGSVSLSSANGGAITVVEDSAMIINALSTGGAADLTSLLASATVTNTSGAINVGGNLKVTTEGGGIILDNTNSATTTFQSLTLNTNGDAGVTIKQTSGDMVVAGINNGLGLLSLTTNSGTITQNGGVGGAAANKIISGDVTINTSNTATKLVTLDNASNSVESWNVTTNGGNVTLREADAMVIAGMATASGTASLTTLLGGVSSAGNMIVGGQLKVDTTAGSGTIDLTAGTTLNFGSLDLASGTGTITVGQTNGNMVIDNLQNNAGAASTAVTLEALLGSVINTSSTGAQGDISVTNKLKVTTHGAAITLNRNGGQATTSFGKLDLDAGNAAITVDQSSGNMDIANLSTIKTGAAAASLTVASGNDITNTGSISVTGQLQAVTAGANGDINLVSNTGSGVTTGFGSLDLTAGGGSITVKQSSGAMVIDNLQNTSVGGTATLETTASAVSITNTSNLGAQGDISVAGKLKATTNDGVITLNDNGTNAVTSFGSLDLTAMTKAITVTQTSGNMVIAGINASAAYGVGQTPGALSLTTTDTTPTKGTITQASTNVATDKIIAGAVTINTSAANVQTVTLNNTVNNVASWNVNTGVAGGTVTLVEINGMDIKGLTSGIANLTALSGDITQSSGTIAASNVTLDTSTGSGNITLNNANVLTGNWAATTSGAGTVSIKETDVTGMQLAAITTAAGSVTVENTSGAVQTNAAISTTGGNVAITATAGAITQDGTINVSGGGGTAGVTMDSTGLGSAINVNATIATGSGGVDLDTAGAAAITAGITTANGIVSIRGLSVADGGAIATSGGAVTLTSTGGLISQTQTITTGGGAVTFDATNGAITHGAAISTTGGTGAVTMTTDTGFNLTSSAGITTAGADVTLTSGANVSSTAGTIATSGGNVIMEAVGAVGSVTIGSINTTGGALGAKGTLIARITNAANNASTITDLATATINVGATTLTSQGGTITVNAGGGGSTKFDSLVLTAGAGAIAVTQTSGDMLIKGVTTTSTLTLTNTDGAITQDTSGASTKIDAGTVTVVNSTTNAGAGSQVLLNNDSNVVGVGGWSVNAGTGANAVTLHENSAMYIDGITTGGALTLKTTSTTAGAAAITQSAAAISAGSASVDTSASSSAITLNTSTTNALTGAWAINAGTGAVQIQENGAMQLDGVTSGALTLTTLGGGALTQTANAISAGVVTLNTSNGVGGAITLDTGGNTATSWTISTGGQNASISETGDMAIAGTTTTGLGTLTLTATGNISDSTATSVTAASVAFASGGSVTLDHLVTSAITDSYATDGDVHIVNTGTAAALAMTVDNILIKDTVAAGTTTTRSVYISNSGNNITLNGFIAATDNTGTINYNDNLTSANYGSVNLKYLKDITITSGKSSGSILSGNDGFLKAESFNLTAQGMVGSGTGNSAIKVDWESTLTASSDTFNVNLGDLSTGGNRVAIPALYIEKVGNGHSLTTTEYSSKFIKIKVDGADALNVSDGTVVAKGLDPADSATGYFTAAGHLYAKNTALINEVADFFVSLSKRVDILEQTLGSNFFDTTNTVSKYIAQLINGPSNSSWYNSTTGITFNPLSSATANDATWSAGEFFAGVGPDGTSSTFYSAGNANIIATEAFNRVNLLADFKAAGDSIANMNGGANGNGDTVASKSASDVLTKVRERVDTAADTASKVTVASGTLGDTTTITGGAIAGASLTAIGTVQGATVKDNTTASLTGGVLTAATVNASDTVAVGSAGNRTTVTGGEVTATGTVAAQNVTASNQATVGTSNNTTTIMGGAVTATGTVQGTTVKDNTTASLTGGVLTAA
ncbi:MAG: hypothetical protein HQL97_09230, partial [Magnetococcales bacterium]|nr:hypothetical protein [Magnetococcales bacterium]